jgi:fatty-acyl-CoA synthase
MSPFATLGDALAAAARAAPSRTALVFPASGRRLAFAAWHEASLALARALVEDGFRPGDRLALLAENRIEWPIVQMAAAQAGLVLVPLNTHYRREDLEFALRRSRAKGLFLAPAFRSNRYAEMVEALRPGLPDLRRVWAFGVDEQDGDLAALVAAGRLSTAPLPRVGAGDVAGLLYTSGTTGFPKGALLSHRAMLGDSWGSATRLGIAEGDRWTSIIPLFHCAGCIMNVTGALQVRATYVGVPAFDAAEMCRIVAAERCTVLTGVPTSYLAMLQHPERRRHDLSSLRVGTCGGADADAEMLAACAREFPVPGLAQVYGMTETSTLIACAAPDDPERFATAGPPLPGMEARITDPETRAVLPAGAVGQVEARGVGVMRGYDDEPEATAAVLDADGWLRTGDLGRITPTGRLQLAGGRLSDMIIRGGENVYPVEVERVLARHPAVAEVQVFAVADPYYGEIVAAAIRPAGPLAAADLAAFCAERIARFKVPARFFRVASFPATASGKIRKRALREQAERGELEPLA